MAGFAERWGDTQELPGWTPSAVLSSAIRGTRIRSGNADPDLLALCPLRVNLVEKRTASRGFCSRARPPLPKVVRASPWCKIEDVITTALQTAVAAAEGR